MTQNLVLAFLFLLVVEISSLNFNITVNNPSFELPNLSNWRITEQPFANVSSEQARTGQYSVKFEDLSSTSGCNLLSDYIPFINNGTDWQPYLFRVTVSSFNFRSGSGLGIYLLAFDSKFTAYSPTLCTMTLPNSPLNQWITSTLTCSSLSTLPNVAYFRIQLRSYSAANNVGAYVDDISIVQVQSAFTPAIPRLYKQDASKGNLTQSDMIGPDGLVYPKFYYAGLQTSEKNFGLLPLTYLQNASFFSVRSYGAIENDNLDDSTAIQIAIDDISNAIKNGTVSKAVLQLHSGTYYLDYPVTIRQSNLIIKGTGQETTKVYFRYNAQGTVRFFSPSPSNPKLFSNTVVEIHIDPSEQVSTISLSAIHPINRNTILLSSIDRASYTNDQFCNRFSITVSGNQVNALLSGASGNITFIGQVTYANGTNVTNSMIILVQYTNLANVPRRVSVDNLAAFNFQGQYQTGSKINLIASAIRGMDTILVSTSSLQSISLTVGDTFVLNAPTTTRFNTLYQNANVNGGAYRNYIFTVKTITAVNATVSQIQLNQPLRLFYPLEDVPTIQKVLLLQWSGIEDVYIEHLSSIWISSVIFDGAQNCWAKNIKVVMPGRYGVYGFNSKHLLLENITQVSGWYKGCGGTNYGGIQTSYDCLIQNMVTYQQRHAPLVQWSAAGNVIRKSTFYDSDLQYHAGYANENLVEQCVWTCSQNSTSNGCYGYGAWASPNDDVLHGPSGPRNVIYNNNFGGYLEGIWIGGFMESLMVLYNRFASGKSVSAVTVGTSSVDHIFKGNVIVMQDNTKAVIKVADRTSVGMEFEDNIVIGSNGEVVPFYITLEKSNRNQFLANASLMSAFPTIPTESLFLWQYRQAYTIEEPSPSLSQNSSPKVQTTTTVFPTNSSISPFPSTVQPEVIGASSSMGIKNSMLLILIIFLSFLIPFSIDSI